VPTYVSLLRGVNVGGRNQVAMAALRDLYAALGHRDVTTYVQSGNVVSSTSTRRAADVEQSVEGAIAEQLGLDVVVLVRTPSQLTGVVAANPFAVRQPDPTKLFVTFLRDAPAPAVAAAIDPDRFAPDVFAVSGREVYLHCPGGYGNTKINNNYFEKQLGVSATTRNWKTVGHLAAVATS
jgi:uncharacterized protein (DUF1697 family)